MKNNKMKKNKRQNEKNSKIIKTIIAFICAGCVGIWVSLLLKMAASRVGKSSIIENDSTDNKNDYHNDGGLTTSRQSEFDKKKEESRISGRWSICYQDCELWRN